MSKPSDLIQGTLDLLILKTVSLEPKHGWAIAKRIQLLSDDVLSRARVIIFNDASPTDTLAVRLRRFVENGGGLLIALGSQAAWPANAAEWLPASESNNGDGEKPAAG